MSPTIEKGQSVERASIGKPIPKEYLEGLSLEAQLLKKLAAQKPATRSQRRTFYEGFKEVSSDLEMKVSGPQSGGEVARVVEVFVHAKRGADDLGAYQVWYVTKGWAKHPDRFKPFDRLTDPSKPSSMKLAPGNYFIWLSKGQPVTERQPARSEPHPNLHKFTGRSRLPGGRHLGAGFDR